MTSLGLSLDDTDFAGLIERARALIPAEAPSWTDHNLHDPGITLLELLGFVADTQVYALGRMRRDERLAYSALFGLVPRGPLPARGLVWPDPPPAGMPGAWLPRRARVLAPGRPEAPGFASRYGFWRSAARLVGLRRRMPDGTELDLTVANGREGASFAPFGDGPGAGGMLRLTIAGPLFDGLPARRAPVLALGVGAEEEGDPGGGRLWARLATGFSGPPVAVLADGSAAFARSGVVLLRFPADFVPEGGEVAVDIGLDGTPSLPPRVTRLALNVLAVEQQDRINEELAGTGLPDQEHTLRGVGLRYGPGAPSLLVRTLPGGPRWRQVPELGMCGPAEAAFTLDAASGVLRFGNGVNGMVPPAGAVLGISAAGSAGALGNVPAGLAWVVEGMPWTYGRNIAPMVGGADAETLLDLRQRARRLQAVRPLVTNADLCTTALAEPGLHVGRAETVAAWEPALPGLARSGTRTLVALRRRRAGEPETEEAEPALWLAAVAARLRPRLPLGERLVVTGPRYVRLGLRARLVLRPGAGARGVVAAARQVVQVRLAALGDTPWPLQHPVSAREITGWLRRLDGVAAVASLALLDAHGQPVASDPLPLGPAGLPLLRLGPDDIVAESRGGGT